MKTACVILVRCGGEVPDFLWIRVIGAMQLTVLGDTYQDFELPIKN